MPNYLDPNNRRINAKPKDTDPSHTGNRTRAANRSAQIQGRNAALNGEVGILATHFGITGREARVILLKGRGLTHNQVADELGLAHDTIKSVVYDMLQRLRGARQEPALGLYQLVFEAGRALGSLTS